MLVTTRRRWGRILLAVRIVRARPRLFASALVGLIVVALLPAAWRPATRVLVGWDLGVGIYLALAYRLIALSHVGHIRLRARVEDEGRITILVLTSAAALATLGAIVAELGSSSAAGSVRPPAHLILAIVTIGVSWAFTHTIFALHYAHEYYDENDGKGGGMEFPDKQCEPDYWDFMYFSFVIGMCAQVSDVTVSCRPIRRTVFAHSVVSFIFNAALLALTVNIAASAI